MKMEPMKSKMKGVFTLPNNKTTSNGKNNNTNSEELEIRPGGMLVQKRESNSNIQNSITPIPIIKVKVKFGSTTHHININSQASFGELKKMLAECTGVHHLDQKLIYKKKERDSKSFLDVIGVKNGSKITLVEDITSREKRCLEMLKSAKIEKISKSLQIITSEVDKLSTKVVALEGMNSRKEKVAELDVDNLIENLMNKLVELDGIVAIGDLKLQKGLQVKRVQKYIETLDKLKLQSSKAKKTNEANETTKVQVQKEANSVEKMAIQKQHQPILNKQKSAVPLQQQQKQVLKHSESFVITTNWETFD